MKTLNALFLLIQLVTTTACSSKRDVPIEGGNYWERTRDRLIGFGFDRHR